MWRNGVKRHKADQQSKTKQWPANKKSIKEDKKLKESNILKIKHDPDIHWEW